MYFISSNKKSGTDPYRVKKEEFLHRLHQSHRGDKQGLDLDLGEMSAAHMLASRSMVREGIEKMSVEERLALVGEMTHAIGATTNLAQHQVKAMLEREKRSKVAAAHFRKQEMGIRSMLERKK